MKPALSTLDHLSVGATAVVRELDGGNEFSGRLAAMGLVLGAALQVMQNSGKGPMLVRVRDTRLALGRGEAQRILVERVPP
ncbi:MAG TPA: FeoA family protein [Thauera sp.]|jgi:ferrous iron transport protein A|uniref:FeoA family protein n=1 Tax=Thauera sp. TaxID=1905334 RepID=UPI000FB3B07C|nr:FeoA family protein [Thauera sp.]RTL27342.1 MAG: ferrous iron transport protein A [Rhodocyclaceae bacterium]MBP7467899.1 FeoA domain-containing protein [Thauera sp.]MBP7640780.1 FeoA domain-containing protein [Thauera sp.]MCB1945988.1 FeoA domain-containing protein [Thauera sp.]MCP5226399.1 FeoA domain-containing protein [Thauera sp.]